MDRRLKPICIRPQASIRDAMRAISTGPVQDLPSPSGIALIIEGDTLLGIATDGDIRKNILEGASLDDPIENIMKKDPVTVLHSDTPDEILARFHDAIRERGLPESRFHHIITVDEQGELVNVMTPFELWRQSEVKIKTVAVIGLGYVGLTLALTLNEFGIRVIGVDTKKEVVEKLKKGKPHFYEKGLESLLTKHINNNLTVTTDLHENESDIFVISVGTPISESGDVDDTYLKEAVTEVGKVLKPHDLVILRSTVPLGTCQSTVIPILEKESSMKAGKDFFVAFAPERTVEGKALEELRTLPQIIGGVNQQSLDEAAKFFRIFVHTIVTVNSLEEAEAVKLLNNTFRDVSFGFANEVAQVLSRFDLSARNVIRAANEGYTRNPIPYPSPGVGGACLTKDPYIYHSSAQEKGYDAQLPMVARRLNESMIDLIVSKVNSFCSEQSKDPGKTKIFLMGMAFKGQPETSDIRYSTSVEILRSLQKTYKRITVYDPVADREELSALGVTVEADPVKGFDQADCVLVLNNHPSYADLDIYTLANTMKRPGLLFDPWGFYTPEQISELKDIHYMGL